MKNQKRLTCTYLYADGHAVQVFEKQDPDAGEVKFVEITEKFTEAHLSFKGRLIFDRFNDGLTWLAQVADTIHATEATIEHGSTNTQQRAIPVGYLEFGTKRGRIVFRSLPDLISGPYTYQPEQSEAFDPDCCRWASHKVAKIHRVKASAKLEGEAA